MLPFFFGVNLAVYLLAATFAILLKTFANSSDHYLLQTV